MSYKKPTENKLKELLQDIVKDSEVYRLLKEKPEEVAKKYEFTKEESTDSGKIELYLVATRKKQNTVTAPPQTIVMTGTAPGPITW